MTTIHNTTIIEPAYLPTDCWSEVLSFMPTRERFLTSQTNKEIYESLRFSFIGQTINLVNTKITDAGLAHLRNVKVINLQYCKNITGYGLAHLSNVEDINLWGCQGVTDAGLAHLSNVDNIGLSGCEGITDAGLAHLSNVKEIDLRECYVTDAGLAYLENVKVINLTCCCDGVTDSGKQRLRARGVQVIG